jgi:hypothetical protein
VGGFDRNLWNAKAIHDIVALMPFCQNLELVEGARATRQEVSWSPVGIQRLEK